MIIELRQYSYFVALAEELHFAKAAERRGISQPALSQQIRALESTLGASLLSRNKRRLELTRVGEVFYKQAIAVLQQADSAQHAIVRAAEGKAGRVTISYVASAALSGVLPSIVYQYRQTCPEIELVLHEKDMAEQLAAVLNGQCDIGFIRPPIGDLPDNLILFDVLREPVMVALRSNHRCARLASINLADLREDTFICVHRKEGVGFYGITMSACRAAGFEPQIEVMSSQMSIVISMVAAGFGVAIVPASTQTFMPPDVVFRPLENNDITSALSMIYCYNNHSPAVQMFVKVARAWTRDSPTRQVSGLDQTAFRG